MPRMDETTPVQHPQITFAGVTYTLRYRRRDLKALQSHGIDLLGDQQQTFSGKNAMDTILLLFKHGVAHEFPDLDIDKFSDDLEQSDLLALKMVIQESQVKALAQASAGGKVSMERMEAYGKQILANLPEEARGRVLKAQQETKPN